MDRTSTSHPPSCSSLAQRIDRLDWRALYDQLDARGFAVSAPLLTAHECRELAALFETGSFRSTVEMARHRFGSGRYRYFARPLPEPVEVLRHTFYRHLAPVANSWFERLGEVGERFPRSHDELVSQCRAAGQERPTPLLLRYGPGDWNALHQDLYGDIYFPFQIVVPLSQPQVDFEGGEFVLLEQRPRAQSRAHVLQPTQGACVIFPTEHRPQQGARGYHKVKLRHGISTLTRGSRTALGVIFHDAK